MTEDGSTMVCMTDEENPDPYVPSVHGPCDDCGTPIHWSENSPVCDKRICGRCFSVDLAAAQGRGDGIEVNMEKQQQVIDEVIEYLRRKQ